MVNIDGPPLLIFIKEREESRPDPQRIPLNVLPRLLLDGGQTSAAPMV